LDQVPAVQQIIAAAGVAIDWDEHLAGIASVQNGAAPLPASMLASIRKSGLALKTKLLTQSASRPGNFNVQFRKALDLFATVRPLKNLAGLSTRHRGVDLLVIRELTEDFSSAI